MSAWRQNSDIWLRIWSFFIGPEALKGMGNAGGQPWLTGMSYHRPPTEQIEMPPPPCGTGMQP